MDNLNQENLLRVFGELKTATLYPATTLHSSGLHFEFIEVNPTYIAYNVRDNGRAIMVLDFSTGNVHLHDNAALSNMYYVTMIVNAFTLFYRNLLLDNLRSNIINAIQSVPVV